MSQPAPFVITNSFAGDEAGGVGGRSTVRTAALDALFAAAQVTLRQLIANLALIQRDDTNLLDGVVKLHTLSSDVLALLSSAVFRVRGAWVGGTVYAVGDVVLQGGIVYVCIVAHTGGTFATDLAASDWGPLTSATLASNISFAPTTNITATNVQGAISELDSDLRPMNSLLARELFQGL